MDYKISKPEKLDLFIDLDTIYGGIKNLHITADGSEFVFTNAEIKELLQKFKRGLPRY